MIYNVTMTRMGTDEALGFEPPQNTQFSVFLDNRVGKLLELLECFEGQSLTLAALTIINSADCAVVRLITSHAVLAQRLLTRHQLAFSMIDVLVVQLTPDRGLPTLCKCLLQAEISVNYVYPLMIRPQGRPALTLHSDNLTLAGQILRKKMFTLLGENDLGENALPG